MEVPGIRTRYLSDTKRKEAAKSKLCSSRPLSRSRFRLIPWPLQQVRHRVIFDALLSLLRIAAFMFSALRRWRSFAGIMFVMDPEALRFDRLVPCCGHVWSPKLSYNLQIQLESKGRWWLRTRMISGMLIIWFPLAIVSWLSLLGTLSS